MIKVLAIGLGVALSFGVASAQPKKAPRKRAPAAAKKPVPKTDPAPTQPDPAPDAQSATPTATPATLTNPTPSPARPEPAPTGKLGAPGAKPTPLKTDEKAGTQLDRRGGTGDYRTVSEGNERAASMAFREGNERLNDGLFVKAAEAYRKALAAWDHPAIHYNLALALINLDQPIEVYNHLNKALQYGAEPLEKDKFDHGKEYLRLIEGQLADVEVSCDKPGAKVSVDGKEVFVAPGTYKAKVRVGKHTFHADKEGHPARAEAPFIGAGETYRINLKVYTTKELTRHRRKWQRAWVPYAVMGGGAAIGITGGLFALSAQSSYDEYNQAIENCNQPSMGCDINEHKSLRDSGDSKRLMGFIGYGVAGAAIATGAVLAWINRTQPYQITPEQLEQSQPGVAVTPLVSPNAVGAMVQGHF